MEMTKWLFILIYTAVWVVTAICGEGHIENVDTYEDM
jgi:hypothetical protein